jgi:hypothetical protein
VSLQRAFDEARFGPDRTLNLRAHLPTARQAVVRAEAWLRERQVAKAGEVLVITGRGNGSDGGVPVVREAVARLLASLRRRNVVADVREHTPGSFVVRLAPVHALFEAPARRREPARRAVPDPEALAGLAPDTRARLRELAVQSINALGVQATERTHGAAEAFVRDEMLRQFAALSPAAGDGGDRELRLRAAIERALEEYEEL